MEKLITEEMVESILANDKESFMAAFNAALAAKVNDALEVKKVEVASTLIAPAAEVTVEEEAVVQEMKEKDDEEDDEEEDDEEDDEDEKDMKEEVEQVDEKAIGNAYAIGMAQAMKSTGDKPPLKKTTIMKAHKIARSVMKKK